MNYPHGDLLRRKSEANGYLLPALDAYEIFVAKAEGISVTNDTSVIELVSALNEYREASIYIFEGGVNVPQSNLRSTIMEEFLIWLFKDIFEALGYEQPENYQIGKSIGSYLSLDFAPHSFEAIFGSPGACIHKKDQDFTLGANISIAIDGNGNEPVIETVTLPVIAIECKTYLAKNHLDMCSSTAASLKKAMPYCKYIILAEFIKLGNNATPEFTDVSEIYVVCKAKNTERKKRKDDGMPPHPVHEDVVINLFQMVLAHLQSIWWDPDSVLKSGVVIGRPR